MDRGCIVLFMRMKEGCGVYGIVGEVLVRAGESIIKKVFGKMEICLFSGLRKMAKVIL